MLLEIVKLCIKNEGFRREISLKKMYINSNSIVSISDYNGAKTFLEEELSHLSQESFSLLRVNNGSYCEDIIVKGSAGDINNKVTLNTKKDLLHD